MKDIGKESKSDPTINPETGKKWKQGEKYGLSMPSSGKKINYRDVGVRTRAVRSNAEFDPMDAYKLRQAGFSYAKIGEFLAVNGRAPFCAPAIERSIKRLIGEDDAKLITKSDYVQKHNEARQMLLEKKHMLALKNITSAKLKEESARDNAFTAKMLHEQLRLEQNKSTSNVAATFAQMVEKSQGANGL